MSLGFFLIFFILRYLQKLLKSEAGFAYWKKIFPVVMIAAIVVGVAGIVIHTIRPVTEWVALLGMGWLTYILYRYPLFKPARNILIAIAPFVGVTLLVKITRTLFPVFSEDWKELLDNLGVFAVLWGMGVWFVTSRQRKELEKARRNVEEEQQNNRVISEMKEQLEVQVAERTAELTKQNEALESALEELKSTQAQLIHSEKMASLGELTAGIAHEIQNPLNFVNNFSEVNAELIEELKTEKSKADSERDAGLEEDILRDLSQNLEKISFHGKRADAIVKGMLQHSRTSSGQKELTDINDLCDEYLRLAFHGLRAKDKSFNADFKTDFADDIQKIEVVPQDMGRVLLNLLNNAFYAVNERKKTADASYTPTVLIQTRKKKDEVEITVQDNGNGIPQAVVDKIFQPFFTTKPTGQGTGLGLSLAYDIVKVHGGGIKVNTRESEGTTFIIELPL